MKVQAVKNHETLDPYFPINPYILIDNVIEHGSFTDLKVKIEIDIFNQYKNNVLKIDEDQQDIPSFTFVSDLLETISKGPVSDEFENSFVKNFSQFPIIEYFRFFQSPILLYILQFTPRIRKHIIDTLFTKDNIAWLLHSDFELSFEFDNLYLLYRLLVGSKYSTIKRQDLRFYAYSLDAEDDTYFNYNMRFINALTFNEDTEYALSIDKIGLLLFQLDDIFIKLLSLTLICQFSQVVPDTIEDLLAEVKQYGPHDLFFKLRYAKKFPDYPHNMIQTIKEICQFIDYPVIIPSDFQLKYFDVSTDGSTKKILYDTQAFIAGIEQLLTLEDTGVALESLDYILPFYRTIKEQFHINSYFSFPDSYNEVLTTLEDRRDYPANRYIDIVIEGTLAFIFTLTKSLMDKKDTLKLFHLIDDLLP